MFLKEGGNGYIKGSSYKCGEHGHLACECQQRLLEGQAKGPAWQKGWNKGGGKGSNFSKGKGYGFAPATGIAGTPWSSYASFKGKGKGILEQWEGGSAREGRAPTDWVMNGTREGIGTGMKRRSRSFSPVSTHASFSLADEALSQRVAHRVRQRT